MVYAEDKEFEDDILSSGYHIAVPVQIEKKSGGELKTIAYSFAIKKAEEFEKLFGNDPFSDEAVSFLHENIGSVMGQMEFDYEHAADRLYYEYRCTAPDTSKIIDCTEIIDTLDGVDYEESLELDAFELDPDNKIDRMAVIRNEDGKVICYAGLDDISDNDGLLEITVECSEEYRHRGYATSCVSKLTEYLISLGEGVKYVCENDNVYSKMTAAAAGYDLYKTVLPYVCYKGGRDGSEEDDED